jgi:hypothetical protein
MGDSAWMTASLAKLHNTMVEMDKLWQAHIALEEEHMGSEMAKKILTPQENVQLGDQIGAHAQQHTLPAEWCYPLCFTLCLPTTGQ